MNKFNNAAAFSITRDRSTADKERAFIMLHFNIQSTVYENLFLLVLSVILYLGKNALSNIQIKL